jgi:hypothetical protein
MPFVFQYNSFHEILGSKDERRCEPHEMSSPAEDEAKPREAAKPHRFSTLCDQSASILKAVQPSCYYIEMD